MSIPGGGLGGGGAGGYFRKTLTLTSADWGKTIDIGSTVAGTAATVVSSGTKIISTLTARIGNSGSESDGGAGGTASGGDINTAGAPGENGIEVDGTGGRGTTGLYAGPYGTGAFGGVTIGDAGGAAVTFS